MQLPGHLGLTTLGDLLGALHRAAATGTLELVEDKGITAGRTHRIGLRRGLVTEVDTPLPVDRLGEILHREGFVTRDALSRATGERRGAIGQALLHARAVTEDALRAALRHQLRIRLERLFGLTEALIRFRVPRPARGSGSDVPLSPREFLTGRPRARTRRVRRTPTSSRELVRANALKTLGLGPHARTEDVQHAFRSLARDAHPDRHPMANDEERRILLRRFAELSGAYHTLVG